MIFDPSRQSVVVMLGLDRDLAEQYAAILGPTGFVLCYQPDSEHISGKIAGVIEGICTGDIRIVTLPDREAIIDAIGPDRAVALIGVCIVRGTDIEAGAFLEACVAAWEQLKYDLQTIVLLSGSGMEAEIGNAEVYAGAGGVVDLAGVWA